MKGTRRGLFIIPYKEGYIHCQWDGDKYCAQIEDKTRVFHTLRAAKHFITKLSKKAMS